MTVSFFYPLKLCFIIYIDKNGKVRIFPESRMTAVGAFDDPEIVITDIYIGVCIGMTVICFIGKRIGRRISQRLFPH